MTRLFCPTCNACWLIEDKEYAGEIVAARTCDKCGETVNEIHPSMEEANPTEFIALLKLENASLWGKNSRLRVDNARMAEELTFEKQSRPKNPTIDERAATTQKAQNEISKKQRESEYWRARACLTENYAGFSTMENEDWLD